MAVFNAEYLVAFATQTDTDAYDPTLDAIAGTIIASDGLLLGDAESGVKGSGLDLTLGRSFRDKAFVSGTFTRSISDFLKAEVRTFTFALPWVGNRALATATPVDGDAVPLAGMDALLEGAGMVGTAWGAGVGHSYVFGSPQPISALVYHSGNRLELMNCRCSLAIDFEVGGIPILTATVEVGSIKDHALANIPGSTTYGPQQTVSAEVVEGISNDWGDTRGFSEATLAITPTFEDIPDSNQTPAVRIRQTDREVQFSGTLYADDTSDDGYEYSQMIEPTQANLDQLSFQVGASMVDDSTPAKAIQVLMPDPELDEMTPVPLGDLAGNTVTLNARGTAGDDELEIIFR
jgi:hypothetical protein